MIRLPSGLTLAIAMIASVPAMAQPTPQERGTDAGAAAATQAVGVDLFSSSDADHTDISKLSLDLDWRHLSPELYAGLRVEAARFRPLGQDATQDLRLYYRFADKGKDWSWDGQIGTDGDTVLGAFDIHNAARFRQEYFVEREIVETPQGLKHGIYYTFAGGALDLPVNDANNLNILGAVQDFTGDNVRLHLRASYVHVLNSDWGLTAQVRTRVFHSSKPGEFDYFSPEWYAEALPVLQLRRHRAGWRYLLAAGVGVSRQSASDWNQARYLNAEVTSPANDRGWAFGTSFLYSNTPTGAGYTYDYRQFSLGVTRSF